MKPTPRTEAERIAGWQPRETAPQGGYFWGWCQMPSYAEARIIERINGRFIGYGMDQNVIYWQPIHKPEPPQLLSQDQTDER